MTETQGTDSKRSVGKNVRLGFAAVVVLLLLSAGVSLHNTRQLYENTELLAKNQEILETLSDILSTLKDVEIGQRSYIITGEKEFLDPYLKASTQIKPRFDRLSTLLAEKPETHARLQALEEKISVRLAFARRGNELRAEKGFDAAREFVAKSQGNQLMDELRGEIAQMEAQQRDSARRLEAQCARSYLLGMLAHVLVVVLGLGLLGVAFQLVRRELAGHFRTRAALHEQREWLRVTLTSIGDAVIVTDKKGVVVFLNPIAESLTGWKQDALGQELAAVFRIIDEGTRQPCESPVSKVLREGAIVGLANHTVLISKNGKEIAIDDSGAPIRDSKGRIDGVVLVFREITARRRVEEALRTSELRYRRLFETARNAILILDADTGIIIDGNPGAVEVTGYTRPEVTGKQLWQIGIFESLEVNRAALAQIRAQGTIRYDNLSIATEAGVRAEAECVAIAYEMDGKQFIQFSIHDITARVRAEEALRAARDRFRSVVDHVIHGIISIDESGRIESVNPAAERLFGYDAAEMVGQNVKLLMPEPYHSEHDSYLINFLETGEPKIIGTGREVVGLRKDGSTFPMELAVSTFPLGKRRLFTGIVQDITARKCMEEELRERLEQLRDADRRKNEFLAMLAHELRNPLAPIQNAVHLLRKNCPTDVDTQWAHDVIERQVQHMTRLVDDLLDVSRITRGLINLRIEPIEIAAVVERAVEMTQPLIDEHKHQLLTSLPLEPVRVEADLSRLAQVLANLLNNAAKYTEEAGSIWLNVERHEGDVLIKVRDSGIGIPPEYLPRVFDLFSQEDSSLERTHGGLGIGLTLVRVLVKMHGGAIQAFSAGSGQGSEFVLRLPALSDTTPLPAEPATATPVAVLAPRRILVVDDNVDGAQSLSLLLQQEGHEVHTANDGPSALALARATALDVVLLDVGMPHMSGLEVARRLRGELGLTSLLLVAMTGYGQNEDRRRTQEAGFDVHLIKPLDLDMVRKVLAQSDVPKPKLLENISVPSERIED